VLHYSYDILGVSEKYDLAEGAVFMSDNRYSYSLSPYVNINVSLSLITVARVDSTLQPCSSNQCDTARLTRPSNRVHLIP
jgi:hypothetical protein